MPQLERSHPLPPAGTAKGTFSVDLTLVFMLVAAGLVIGTILQQPSLRYCDNDASRWSTVYYLVRYRTYEFLPGIKPYWSEQHGQPPNQLTPEEKNKWFKIGELYYSRPSAMPIFPTIDMVKLNGKFYSSKPPLLSTCVAGVVRAIQNVTGQKMLDSPWFVTRTTVILVQVVPLLIMFRLVRNYLYRLTDCPFVRNFSMAVVTLATYLTPWTVTFNNHVIAACTAMFALHAALRIWYDGRREWYWFALVGFFAAFTAGIELPAGLLAVGLFAGMMIRDAKRTLLIGLPIALVPTIMAIHANYTITGELIPAYVHVDKSGGPYDYEGSYWRQPWGTDALCEPKHIYLANMLIGHHGFFSLTPVFVLSLIGMMAHLVGRSKPRMLAAFVLILSAMVTAVYTVTTHNYGGACQGFRWLFWIIPFWLLFLPSGVQLLARSRLGRSFCYLLLGISMVTVGFAFHNPWPDRSWLHMLFIQFGWIAF